MRYWTAAPLIAAALAWTAPASADPAPAPDVWWSIDGTMLGDSSSNVKPVIRDIISGYNEPGPCEGPDWEDCDVLRFGLAIGAGPNCADANDDGAKGDVDPLTVYYDPGEDVGIDFVQPRMDTIPGEDNGHQSARTYCGDNEPELHAHDEHHRALWEATFPGTTTANNHQMDMYWERPHLQVFALKDLAQSWDGTPGTRVIDTLQQLCVMHAGPNGLPSMPTWVYVERYSEGPQELYGGLLAAAGGTGDCEIYEAGAWSPLDVCAHVNDPAVTEATVRGGIHARTYRCGAGDEIHEVGSLDNKTSPGGDQGYQIMHCHMTGTGDDDCNKRLKTDLLGILSCVRQLPRGVTGADAVIRWCEDTDIPETCVLLTEENGDFEWIDERQTLFVLTNRDRCTAGGIEITSCEDGLACDTGLAGRCGPGAIDCSTGTPQCMPIYTPYPEICNGLDDDCDGMTDMMSVSWSNPEFASYSLPPEHAGLDCNQINVCRCADGATETHDGTTWESFLDSWDGVCLCGESLEADHTPADAPTPHNTEDLSPSACSAVATGTIPAALLTLVALSLLALGRGTRRRH